MQKPNFGSIKMLLKGFSMGLISERGLSACLDSLAKANMARALIPMLRIANTILQFFIMAGIFAAVLYFGIN